MRDICVVCVGSVCAGICEWGWSELLFLLLLPLLLLLLSLFVVTIVVAASLPMTPHVQSPFDEIDSSVSLYCVCCIVVVVVLMLYYCAYITRNTSNTIL